VASTPARATRRRCPPDSVPTGCSTVAEAHPLEHRGGLAGATGRGQRRRRRVDVGLLRQVRDGQPAAVHHAALVGRLEPGGDAQQGRLAAAVGADDADAVALVQAQADPVQGHLLGVRLADALEADDVAPGHRPAR
jgi:hypothetical protein